MIYVLVSDGWGPMPLNALSETDLGVFERSPLWKCRMLCVWPLQVRFDFKLVNLINLWLCSSCWHRYQSEDIHREGVSLELKDGGLCVCFSGHVKLNCHDQVFVWTVKRSDLQIGIWHEYIWSDRCSVPGIFLGCFNKSPIMTLFVLRMSVVSLLRELVCFSSLMPFRFQETNLMLASRQLKHDSWTGCIKVGCWQAWIICRLMSIRVWNKNIEFTGSSRQFNHVVY